MFILESMVCFGIALLYIQTSEVTCIRE